MKNLTYFIFLFILLIVLFGLGFYFALTYNFPYQFALNSSSKVEDIELYINDALVKKINLTPNKEEIVTISGLNPLKNQPYNKFGIEKVTIYLPKETPPVNFRNINIPGQLICSKDIAGLNKVECTAFQNDTYYTFRI